ncbi:phosphotransferase family protein [Aldersonia sp. NBC_00410]|uniref:phosphotransferase family protein n=1 Tax=Aldersonia sp. NBC_00410 TaxID=2975954 RepID=UPI002253EC1F|nr:phosphotransferase family protein [Aldersonia sp. NBC_00410]MCX5042669.1 phosphotransferase family protein [Aldersonia sp. NBC_00410]
MSTQQQPDGVDRELVDFAVVAEWMDRQGLPGGRIENVAPIGGGTQNVLMRFSRGGEEFVLRRPPRHQRPKSNEVLRREARLLAALADTNVPTPELVAACPDEAVLGGAVFYLMRPIDGFNPGVELPELHTGDASIRYRMGLSAAKALADLGSVDYEAVGLGDYGNKPESFLDRQVSRWLGELETYTRNEGYPGPDIPGIDALTDWLERNRPADWRPGIMHGDCHMSNTMYRYDGPELAAYVDWEMSTIGDPLLDLGWLLATWPNGTALDGLAGAYAAHGGLATAEELIAHYAAHSDRDLSAIDWYVVLACFKLGIVLEGTHARAFAGKAPKEVGDRLHELTLLLFERARGLIA